MEMTSVRHSPRSHTSSHIHTHICQRSSAHVEHRSLRVRVVCRATECRPANVIRSASIPCTLVISRAWDMWRAIAAAAAAARSLHVKIVSCGIFKKSLPIWSAGERYSIPGDWQCAIRLQDCCHILLHGHREAVFLYNSLA